MRKSTVNLSLAAAVLALGATPLLAGGCGGSHPAKASYKGEAAKKDIVGTAVEAGSFQTLATALQTAGLVEALQGDGPFTVFAPTDEAFAALPSGTMESLLKPENRDQLTAVLTYHVVPGWLNAKEVVRSDGAQTLNGQVVEFETNGSQVRIDDAKVTQADVKATNGVIHVIDRVLMPNFDDIVGTAAKAGGFDTLLEAATAAGLVDTLKSEGPFTVFAPTDEAFASLPASTLQALLRPENREQLASVLTYHVVPGRVSSMKAQELRTATTVQSDPLRIRQKRGTLRINDAKVLAADIDASNGIIHVIDEVLIPGSLELSSLEAEKVERNAVARY